MGVLHALLCGITLLVAPSGAVSSSAHRAAFATPPCIAGTLRHGASGALCLRASAGGKDAGSGALLGRPLSRRDALGAALSGAALLGFAPEAFADMAKTEAELTEADRMAAKIREKDATFIQPGKNRNNIKVPKAIRKLKAPKITFPASTADLEDYTLTPSGLYVQELVVGDEAGESPSSGKVLEIHYIGSVCLAESDGTYDCAVKSGPADIYPNLPQGILQNSPSFDSSYGRGRTMKVRYQRAQLSQGLEEALSTMKPGGSRMVFLTPALSFACPKGRQCVADIEIDQRMAFYIKLVSVGEKTDVGA